MNDYLSSVIKQFEYYKLLGEKTMLQLGNEELFWQFNQESNSIAIIVQHLSGNMVSRWTDIFNTDGEKDFRNREKEFEYLIYSREDLFVLWEKGWKVLFDTLNELKENDLGKIIYIRNQGHTVIEAINRQLAHYPYHIGQIVFVGKMIKNEKWESLSIPRGKSDIYNKEKFNQPKAKSHFTDEFLDKDEK